MRYWMVVAIASGVMAQQGAVAASDRVVESADGVSVAVSPAESDRRPLGLTRAAWVAEPEVSAQGEIRLGPVAQAVPPDVPVEPSDRFLQPRPVPTPVPTDEPALESPPLSEPPPSDSDVLIPVRQVEVMGSTVFADADFAPFVQTVEGQSVTLEQLRQVADQITQLYLSRGYITSRAVLVDQVVEDGVVQIRVIEGALEQIEVEGNRRVGDRYIRSRIQLGGAAPLNQGELEDQLRLLKLDPLFENVEASLRAGSGLGLSILTVRVSEAPLVFGDIHVNNYSPPSVGSEKFGGVLGFRSLTGLGDTLLLSYERSTTGGSELYDAIFQVPLNPMNGTLQLRAAPSNFEITSSPFDLSNVDITGDTDLYEVSFRQPLVRTPREELALSLGLTYRDGDTFINDQLISSSTTSVVQFGQDYLRRDVQGAWAVRSQFNIGTSLFDAFTEGEPDGEFLSWLGQLQRVQILDPSQLLIMQADLQLAADPLLGSQQFIIGGGESLRGYRQNVRAGDNGFRVSVEDRITLHRNESGLSVFQLIPFAELGAVWNHSSNPTPTPDQSFLAGVGVGLLWELFPGFSMRLDYGLPLVDLDDRGDNIQDDGLYFNVIYRPQ